MEAMKAVGILMLMIGTVTPDMAGECDMAGFYLELGCTPIPSSSGDLCPDAFKCPDLHPDPTMCYYKGAAYIEGSSIPQNLVGNPCSLACSCNVFNGEAQFSCAAVDCVETFDSDLRDECISTYELDSCCSTGDICGVDAIAQLKTCSVNRKRYRQGEQFQPPNTHKTCICSGQWNGTVDDAFCRDINCATEIHYQNDLMRKCAPVYPGSSTGCPIGFECPTKTSKVIRGLNIRNLSSQCVFGNMTLSVGDEATIEDKCTKCTCSVPPFVTCVRKNNCNPSSVST